MGWLAAAPADQSCLRNIARTGFLDNNHQENSMMTEIIS